ncbi:MAG: NAD-dependent epimerase/dehydratase family protein [Candidatus Hodarchaeota archaeon]
MESIIVTGNLGYIGIILTQDLLNEGYKVIGMDTDYYRDKKLIQFNIPKDILQLKKDIRHATIEDFHNVDAVIHLAALSNDPLGKITPELTNDINYLSSLRLAEMAKKANVSRFLFSSSCSIYGQMEKNNLDEDSTMNPLSAYAHSKVNLEKALSKIADDKFSPVYLRNGTAFGISPNMRFDLVVNNLTGWGYTTKEIKILSDGRAWRPIVHIRDISNAFIAALNAPKEIIHNEAFNVGINSENYQVKSMAEEIHNQMKDCEVKILGKNNPDQRDYNVNFDKIKEKLKNFKPQWTLKKGVKELINTFEDINLSYEIFQDKNFTRLNQLKYLLKNNKLNENLYWK